MELMSTRQDKIIALLPVGATTRIDSSLFLAQRMPYALCARTMGVFVGGALHWVVTRKLELDSPDLIIAFDLKHENFRETNTHLRRSLGKNFDDEIGGLLRRSPALEIEEGLKMALSEAVAMEEMGSLQVEEEEAEAAVLGLSTTRCSQRNMGQNLVKFSSR
ncbi:hypothetical protein K1719_022534 [Acacia pycnantha]|nr:hypothetical protein K1719_022534 [Acacia pycnantha]